jgi:Cu2+-exporting ATPase
MSSSGTDLSSFVVRAGNGVAMMDFALEEGASVQSIDAIESAVLRLKGVAAARLNVTNRRLRVEWREDAFDPALIVARLAAIGCAAHPFSLSQPEALEAQQTQWLLRCLAIAGFAATNIMLLSVSVWAGHATTMTPETRDFFHWLSALIAIPAAAFAGQPFFLSAIQALRTRRVNMDVPISLGVMLALVMSLVETARHADHAYFDSAMMLLFFLLTGRVLDHAMRRKTRALAGNLAALHNPMATRIGPDGSLSQVPVSALALDEEIMVRPGERVAVDGVVASGSSAVDESLVTGETKPRSLNAGEWIYAGSLNMSGVLRVRVRAAVEGTLIGEIERLMGAAMNAKAHYRRLSDRVARLYAPVVHVAALTTTLGWLAMGASWHDSLIAAIAVLIITCPCALALAVPAVQVVAAGSLFRARLLLNQGDAIERLAGADMIVFDKTGTLTLPDLCIANRAAIAPNILGKAARLALASHHPLARPLAGEARGLAPPGSAQETPGEGVAATIDGIEARLGSPAFCNLETEVAAVRQGDSVASAIAFRHGSEWAVFLVRQSLREDAVETIGKLRARKIAMAILSGDRREATEAVAREVGIDDWHAELRPADKVARLEAWKAAGRRIIMVGDGINDAPALAAATASLSPISAADVAQACADAVFLGDRLAPVCAALDICRQARRLMRQNLVLSLVYNAVALPLAVAGLVTPLIAALAMSGSSLLVTLNALRAYRGHADGGGREPKRPDLPIAGSLVHTMAIEGGQSR